MITVPEALAKVLALAGGVVSEEIALQDALGRVLAAPAQAQLTQPPFDASAMDGYAVRAQDLAAGATLEVIGEAAAGHPWDGTARPGAALRIFTGAPVPAGFDKVVMQENVTRKGLHITVNDPDGPTHIRPRGADFDPTTSLPAGRRITPQDLALLAAMNCARLSVARRPRVAILATGDELVAPGETPRPGQIICSNDLAVAALAQEAGAEVIRLGFARDDPDDLRAHLLRGAEADLLVTIGGASVGDHDLIGQLAGELGLDRSFYKIAMRPGKPLMAGKLRGAAMLGLPGNPVSSIVCAMVFMQPLIEKMLGLDAARPVHRARLGADLNPEGDRQHYLRATLHPGQDLPVITPVSGQDSAMMRLLSQADALLIRDAGDPARRRGDVVEYLPLPGRR